VLATYGAQGESLVPPHTRGGVSFSLMHSIRHIIRSHLSQEMKVQNAVDDVASAVHQPLPGGARNGGGGAGLAGAWAGRGPGAIRRAHAMAGGDAAERWTISTIKLKMGSMSQVRVIENLSFLAVHAYA
jgi:hypothetical protein